MQQANVEIPPVRMCDEFKTLARQNFSKKPNAQTKSAQKPNDWASFHERQNWKFSASRWLFPLFYTFFCQKL